MLKLFTLAVIVGGILFGAVSVTAFWGSSDPKRDDRKTQEEILSRAQTVEPAYRTQNFLSRRAINQWAQRLDTPEKLWYVYLMTESGAFIGYHICSSVPLSYGISITNPQQTVSGYSDASVIPAPGIDGVFYTGTDPSVHYCFDAETDALVTFNTQFVYYDAPLNIEAPELRLQVN